MSATLAVIAAVAVFGWFVWLPAHRPSLRPGEVVGIDVSHHQGPIAWDRVAADGIGFAYIKATEGDDFVDERFAENWSASDEAGLRRGAYHFFTLCSPGAAQAHHFLDVVPPDPNALPPAVDLELAQNCSERPDPAALRRELQAYLAVVEAATGRRVVLYIGDDIEDRYAIRGELQPPLWLPRFLLRPSGDWLIWQTSAFAHVDGVEGRVDLDVMRT
ncbi:MAG: lysozyme [Solirubrobacterales bacterium]|nr:lysozyme [Solirubrobacterales bacterium]